MAKVKINNDEYELLRKYISDSNDLISKADNCWGENFDNLYHNFITSGFLDKIYEDSISQYYTSVETGKNVVTTTVSGAALGCALGSVVPGVGNILGAIIGGVVGLVGSAIYEICNPREVKFVTISKETFEQLLENCVYGNDDAYIQLHNDSTKLMSAYVGLYEILAKVNEFNKLYSEIKETADKMSLKTTVANDGVTLLNVNTEIVVNGEKIEVSVSEAMNAFYTYNGTVFSSMIEAQYLAETYGLDVDYKELVKNANGFVTDTVLSGLYTKEFVENILPNHKITQELAVESVASQVGTTTGTVNSILDKSSGALGMIGLYSGLIGATYLGSTLSKLEDKLDTKEAPKDGYYTESKGAVDPTTSSVTGDGTRTDNDKPSTSDATIVTPVMPKVKEEEEKKEKEEKEITVKPEDETKEEETVENQTQNAEIQIATITEEPLKQIESIEKPEPNFDEQALIEYESQGADVINSKRVQLVAEANELYEMDDHTLLKQKLMGYGYTEEECNAIIADRKTTINAIVTGETKKELAEISNRLAKTAGVTDYKSTYSETGGLKNLYGDESRKLLAVSSSDPKVREAYNNYQQNRDNYLGLVDEANELINEANRAKTELDKIKENIEQISGNDKTKWTEEQIQQYNDAVNNYNESISNANEKINETESAKAEYLASQEEYDSTRDIIIAQMLEEQRKSEEENGENVTSTTSSNVELEHGNSNQDNSFSLDELNRMINEK